MVWIFFLNQTIATVLWAKRAILWAKWASPPQELAGKGRPKAGRLQLVGIIRDHLQKFWWKFSLVSEIWDFKRKREKETDRQTDRDRGFTVTFGDSKGNFETATKTIYINQWVWIPMQLILYSFYLNILHSIFLWPNIDLSQKITAKYDESRDITN